MNISGRGAAGFVAGIALSLAFVLVPPAYGVVTVTERPVCTEMHNQLSPAVEGSRVVWEDWRDDVFVTSPVGYDKNVRVWVKDLSTGAERSMVNLADGFTCYWPDISGNSVVCWVYRPWSASNLYTAAGVYNLSTSAWSVFPIDANAPKISGTKIVYASSLGSTLWLRDLVSESDQQLPTGDQCADPAISGTRIAYRWVNDQTKDGRSDGDIALYDVLTMNDRWLTRNTAEQGPPSISGSRVVYADKRNGNWDVYLFDIAADREVRVTSNVADQYDPAISGDKVVWTDKRNGNEDIYLYDIATGSTDRITTNAANQRHPDISGNRIVWSDDRNGNEDIYTATFTTATELAGATRYDTAIAASKAAFPEAGSCDSVIVATGLDYPDALAAAGLAGAAKCPIILVNGLAATADAKTMTEISRLTYGRAARTVYICGGTGAVSAGTESKLKWMYGAAAVTRLAGGTRFTTAQAVARKAVAVMPAHGLAFYGDVFFVTGMDYHDAELVGPMAYGFHAPVLLVGPVDKAMTDTLKAIGARSAIIVGSTSRVPKATEDALATAHFGAARMSRPCSSNDPYAQSVAMAEWATSTTMSWNGLGIATGEDFPDALAAGPLLGKVGAPLLFTPKAAANASVLACLGAHKASIGSIRYFGGTGAIPQTVRDQLEAALQ